MGLFVFLCTIDQTRLELFARLRAEHYGFLITQQSRIRFGGPARASDDAAPETMLIVAEAAGQTDAEAWISKEPYNAHGGFKAVSVRPWTQVLPETAPGALERVRLREIEARSPPD